MSLPHPFRFLTSVLACAEMYPRVCRSGLRFRSKCVPEVVEMKGRSSYSDSDSDVDGIPDSKLQHCKREQDRKAQTHAQNEHDCLRCTTNSASTDSGCSYS